MTWPVTCLAPSKRALINPERLPVLKTLTVTGKLAT